MKKLKILLKVLTKSKESSKANLNDPESHENLSISSTTSYSLLESQVSNETCFSENMSDQLDTNTQDTEMSSNTTMRAAATATASSASQTWGTQPSILRASFLENMQSQDPCPISNYLIDIDDVARSPNFVDMPTHNCLSSVSSTSSGSEPVDELYDAPWRKEMYEALASLTRRHTELIEQQTSHNTTNQCLTREIDQIGGHVCHAITSQRSTEDRISAYDTLQKRCTEQVERVERYLQQVDSNLSNLYIETQAQSRDTNANQLDLTMSLKALTAEIQAIQQNQKVPLKRYESHSTPASYQPRTDTPKYQSLQSKHQVEIKPCLSMQAGSSSAPLSATKSMSQTRSIALDPISPEVSDDSRSDREGLPLRRDDSTRYHTARSRFDVNEYPSAQRDVLSTRTTFPHFISTRKRQRHEAEAPTSAQESDPHTISSIQAATPTEPSMAKAEMLDRKFAEVLSDAMVKGLKPLIEGQDTKIRPATYRGAKDGLIDGWILMMRRHLSQHHATMAPLDQAWRIIEVLEGEAATT